MRDIARRSTDPTSIGVAGVGVLSIAIDGSVLAEATTLHPTEVVEAFSRPPELRVPVELTRAARWRSEPRTGPTSAGPEAGFVTMRLGVTPQLDEDRLLDEAVASAREADVAVVVVGSAEGTESEGYDRDTLSLPGRQDELVRRVAAAQPNTVVVVNSGMPVLMPWVDDVAAVIQVWLPGQAFGEALTDCLLGVVEPGGRLPISIPRGAADSPVLDATPKGGRARTTRRACWSGYRGYDRSGREPLFCFGHGLGYTEWSYDSLVLESSELQGDGPGRGGRRAQRRAAAPAARWCRSTSRLPMMIRAGRSASWRRSPPSKPRQVRPRRARLVIPARAFARFDADAGGWVWRRARTPCGWDGRLATSAWLSQVQLGAR